MKKSARYQRAMRRYAHDSRVINPGVWYQQIHRVAHAAQISADGLRGLSDELSKLNRTILRPSPWVYAV